MEKEKIAQLNKLAEERDNLINMLQNLPKGRKNAATDYYHTSLQSINEKLENLGCKFYFVADMKDYIKNILKKTKPQTYAKFVRVKAVQGTPGQKLITKTSNGIVETVNEVKVDIETKEADWIITSPNGEQYIISDKTFKKKYEIDPEKPEQFKPTGEINKFIKLKNCGISFIAPWGEIMNIAAGGYISVLNENYIYGVQKEEFKSTYKKCDKHGAFLNTAKN